MFKEIAMTGSTIFLHVFSWIISFSILILIICRFILNRKNRRLECFGHGANMSVFDDNTSLLLIGNTYVIVLLFNTTWLIMTINTLAGDMGLENVLLFQADSFLCYSLVAKIFALTGGMYLSFLLQALWCFLKILYHSKLSTMYFCCLPLNRLITYVIFTVVSWIFSIILVIPGYTHFHLFVYFPDLFHCMIPFSNISGFIYALLSTYIIPTLIIISLYLKIIRFIQNLPNRHEKRRARREVAVLQHVLIVCGFLSLGGSPTVAFLLQYILTGQTHPLADRIHELALAIGINSISVGFAILNSYFQLWPIRQRSIKMKMVRSP